MVDGTIDEDMRVGLIYPIAEAHGSLTKRHYIRTLANGTKIVAKKPDRSGHVKTEKEAANQQRFAQVYAKKNVNVNVN